GAGGAAGFGGGAGFRFPLRLSHARIARQGLPALAERERGHAVERMLDEGLSLLALAAPPGAELEGFDLDPVPALGARRGEPDLERRGGPRADGARNVDASPAHDAAVLVEPLRLDDDALAAAAPLVPPRPHAGDAGGPVAPGRH